VRAGSATVETLVRLNRQQPQDHLSEPLRVWHGRPSRGQIAFRHWRSISRWKTLLRRMGRRPVIRWYSVTPSEYKSAWGPTTASGRNVSGAAYASVPRDARGVSAPFDSLVRESGDAQIGNADAAVRTQQQVARLDVAVEQPDMVDGGQPAGGVLRDQDGLLPTQARPGAHYVPQIRALDVLHDEVPQPPTTSQSRTRTTFGSCTRNPPVLRAADARQRAAVSPTRCGRIFTTHGWLR